MLSDLDEAKESCKSKSEFISFLKNKNYEIRYEKHITVRKIGEKKAIRVDTLAKQFGSQYTKAELEKAMGYSTNLADTNTFCIVVIVISGYAACVCSATNAVLVFQKIRIFFL